MATKDITSAEFESVVTKPGIIFVDFWAAWCGPCRMFAPIFEKASEQYPEINFAKVDTEAEQEIAAAAQITSIPTLMVFRDGILVFRQPGALPAESLEQLIGAVQDLNMEEVKKEIGNMFSVNMFDTVLGLLLAIIGIIADLLGGTLGLEATSWFLLAIFLSVTAAAPLVKSAIAGHLYGIEK